MATIGTVADNLTRHHERHERMRADAIGHPRKSDVLWGNVLRQLRTIGRDGEQREISSGAGCGVGGR